MEESLVGDKCDKPKCCKRRIRNPEQWKRVKQKKARLAGKEYLNVRGNYVPARKIGIDCKCKLMCYKHVDESMRNFIFHGFYNLKSYDEQNAYLFGLIRKHDIKRKTNPNSARRTCTYKYYLRFRGREINVCKVAFARIHSISAKKIRGLCEKLDQNILFPKDGRGKHSNRPQKIQPETQELIRRHLYTLLRSGDVRDYFKEDKNHPSSTELNVTKLYKHFLLCYEPEALIPGTGTFNVGYVPRVKMWLYRHVFHQEFRTKDYQLLKKKIEMGYKCSSDLEDTLQDKIFTKKTKRKGSKPQRKQNAIVSIEPVVSVSEPISSQQSVGVGVQTIVQRYPRSDSTSAVIHLPVDVSFASFTNHDGRTQLINNSRSTMDQVIMEAGNRNATMIQINRQPTMNSTVNLQKLNYTIHESHGTQNPATQNYQLFHTDNYHQNIIGGHGEHPIYHLDKGGGELIPLRPIRISSELNMQIPTGY